jgi:hypothetical protein
MNGSDDTAHAAAAGSPAAESALDDIAREYPRWRCWRGVSGLVYAGLRHSSPPVVVRGEDPANLRDSIRRAEANLP